MSKLCLEPIRIIHTADIHLDRCFASSGMSAAAGNRRRQSLRDGLHRIIERAGTWPADALLIAGDLFEHDRLNRDTVAFLQAEFDSIPHVPVFITPGNHDPYISDSPYATERWPGHVVIFSRPVWEAHSVAQVPLTIHGFGFDGPDISQNPFGSLQIPPDDRVHVGVAHGSERNHQPPDKGAYAPFVAADAATKGLAYLALGHFHAFTPIQGEFATTMCYSGAPEGHSFNELGPHHYLEVESDTEGVRVTPVPSSQFIYCAHTLACSDFTTAQQVVSAIRGLPRADAGGLLARVTLVGVCAPTIKAHIEAVEDACAGEFEYLELIDQTEAAEDYEVLAREATSLGGFMQKMSTALQNAPDEARRRLLSRTREVGLAAYRGHDLPIRGARGDER
jgi:hypothetical protein